MHELLRSWQYSRRWFVYLVLTPIIAYMVLFVFFPVGMAFYYSLQDLYWGEFTGFHNYFEAFFEDMRVPKSFLNTFIYALIRIPATIIPGFFIALILNNIHRGRAGLLFGLFAPYVTSVVAFAAVFLYFYSSSGLFNVISQVFGLPSQAFTRGLHQALPSIALMDAWKHIGFDIVIFLAALQNIPRSLKEAAMIDGASRWALMRYITIPLLQPIFLYLVVMLSIWTLLVFEPIYVMTSGGPMHATRSVAFTIFQIAFEDTRLGYASAISFLLFGIVLVVTIILLRMGRKNWEY